MSLYLVSGDFESSIYIGKLLFRIKSDSENNEKSPRLDLNILQLEIRRLLAIYVAGIKALAVKNKSSYIDSKNLNVANLEKTFERIMGKHNILVKQ